VQVCGLALFGLGFTLYIDSESTLYGRLFHLLPSSGPLITLDKIPAVLATTGITILLLSFLGCYGACAESVCFLWLVSQFHWLSKLIIIIVIVITVQLSRFSVVSVDG